MTRSRHYSVVGAILGTGAPLGLLMMRWTQEREPWLELVSDPWLYAYVTAGTIVAMGLFGRSLGAHEDLLERLSLTDALTGLFNRRHFDLRVTEEVHRSVRKRTPLALMIVDLDRFKRINDRYGHLAGDEVLRVIASMVRDSFRATDVVCRYGGEEIAVIAPDTGLEEALLLAERMRERVSQTAVQITGESERITVSVGVAALAGTGRAPSMDDLTARADEALYAAKREGRNRCHPALAAVTGASSTFPFGNVGRPTAHRRR